MKEVIDHSWWGYWAKVGVWAGKVAEDGVLEFDF